MIYDYTFLFCIAWLQCAECKHTLNLDIYRRQKVSSISKEEYQCFLDNKEQLAEMYGKNIRLSQRNKAEIDYEKLYYDYVKLPETMEYNPVDQITVVINNPYQLKIRPEKQIAEVLGLSRSKAKGLLEKGQIVLEPERLRFNCPSN